MKEKDKNGKTNLPDFQRYIKGEMTDRERNAFERELQRDPFAADAAEGFSEISAENAQSDLAGLERQLKSRTPGRQRFVYYRIAASVAVLMIISSVFIIVQRNRDIAKEESGLISKQVPIEIAQPQAITQPEAQKNEQFVISESRSKKAVKAVEAIGAAEGIKTTEPVLADEIPLAISEKKEEVTGFSPAMPAGGKRDFDKYIEENIRVPETLKEGEKAIVIVNFIVRNTGIIDSLKIIKSPGDEFSSEAKRLIIQGPSWNPAKSDGEKIDDEVRLRIVFK